MCTTCGCGEGERRIEGDDHAHSHPHTHHYRAFHRDQRGDAIHRHEHPHHPSHAHHDSHIHEHTHERPPECVVIHHHHYHHNGDVHHHYHHNGDVHHHYHSVSNVGVNNVAPHYAPDPAQQVADHAPQHDSAFTPAVVGDDLHYGHGAAGTHAPGMGQQRLLQIEMDVLSKNNALAEHNREHFAAQHILALNLVSSPGSGKTTLLTRTLQDLRADRACAVIEGDQQTTHDAERIRATGVKAIQVNTGKGCHLDAQMVHDAAHRLELVDNSLLFIENVGNLVCPAGFDLGERHKVAVLSVTEGEDKPLKYPHMFAAASLMIINKIDLLPYLDFDLDACIAYARRVNPNIQVISLSARSGEGMDEWFAWLEAQQCA